MERATTALVDMYVRLTAPRLRDERGDIPGWVMVTVMTAGIVAVLWTVAGSEFERLLKSAISKVENHQ